jgi:hypothetical protein
MENIQNRLGETNRRRRSAAAAASLVQMGDDLLYNPAADLDLVLRTGYEHWPVPWGKCDQRRNPRPSQGAAPKSLESAHVRHNHKTAPGSNTGRDAESNQRRARRVSSRVTGPV